MDRRSDVFRLLRAGPAEFRGACAQEGPARPVRASSPRCEKPGVLTWHGWTALTRMPAPAHSTASSRVIWLMPALATLKLKLPRPSAEDPAIELMLTMLPFFPAASR